MDTIATELPAALVGVDRGLSSRLAGAGGLLFVATLVIQNAIRAKAPGLGAEPATVATYFADHRVAAVVPLALFPFGMCGIVAFVSGLWTRARTVEGNWWAHAGVLGAMAIAALFSLLNVLEIAITVRAHELLASPDVVGALWALHGGAFGLDLAAISIALVCLSRAARSAQLIPPWIAQIALPGAVCLFVPAVFAVALTEGAPWIDLGLVGFIVWALFVVMASISLLRTKQDR